MFITVAFATLLVSCMGAPMAQFGYRVNKAFVCGSSPDQSTLVQEKAVAPNSDLGVRSFLLSKDRQWSHAVIPYEISKDFSAKQVQMIKEAMNKFKEVSCVRWAPRHMQKDYVAIQRASNSDVCNASVGRRGGRQVINFGDNCFDVDHGYQGAIAHEMMHAIGFIHEQQRLDRDCYVHVAKNAIDTRQSDFAETADTDTSFPYDFGSLMHYGTSHSMFARNGESLGNDDGEFTVLDVMKINNMYCGGKTYCQMVPDMCQAFKQAQDACQIKRNY